MSNVLLYTSLVAIAKIAFELPSTTVGQLIYIYIYIYMEGLRDIIVGNETEQMTPNP